MRLAIVGATGAVGQQALKILEQRKFPVTEVVAFSSPRSAGKTVRFQGRDLVCQVMKPGCFQGVQIAFFDASDEVSKEWVPRAAEDGAWVIDNSATYRMDPDVFLLVPEVNGKLLSDRLAKGAADPKQRILAGPNCSTVQLVVALKPIHDRWGLKRVVVSSYQSVSGAGSLAIDELFEQTADHLAGRPVKPKIFAHSIAFNCIPQIGGFKEDAYTSEEQKIMAETRKILGLPGLKVTATAVRVPTVQSHAETVNVECERPFELAEVRQAMEKFSGLKVVDEPARGKYPMAVDCANQDAVYVGRLRRDDSVPHGLNMWVVSDNLRKGAALNGIQIAEMLLGKI
ncbi:MAG: aspartate-semialdehyde dehydrogenase [Bacteriovoracia bacterium]